MNNNANRNIMIPYALFLRFVDFICCLDTSGYDDELQSKYDEIHRELYMKAKRMVLRNKYGEIISATNEEERDDARYEYLKARSTVDLFDLI